MEKKNPTPPPSPVVVIVLILIVICEVEICLGSGFTPQQQEDDKVVHLPGLSLNVSFDHYSGYVTVNESGGKRSLFYWFFKADAQDHAAKPLVLWLQGGPGCSSIGFGEAQEIGPFTVNSDGKTLSLNPYSWNQVANVLFVDSPVGTGFSYSSNSSDLRTNGDKRTADDALAFLLKWLERFPQYKENDFYITGESYAGHYIPQLAQAIFHHQKSTGERSINLRGYMVGNALTDDFNDHSGVSEFLWTTGLISDRTYKLRSIYCHHTSFLHSSTDCNKVADLISAELGDIDIYSIYTPSCISKKVGNINEKFDPCIKEHTGIYFNLPEVQKALHVNPEAAPATWEICSDVIFHTWKDSASSVLGIYKELIASGLRIWMFSGDTDTVIPVTSTRYNIDALGLEPASPWHPWYDDGQVGGWSQQYVGLNFVTIRGAGHKVPLIKPKLAFVLFESFLSGNPMPSSSAGISDS